MGTLADFSVGIGADISDFTSGISKAVSSTSEFASKMANVASGASGPLDGVGRSLSGIGDIAGRSGGAVAGFFRMAFADVLGGLITSGLGRIKDGIGSILSGMIGGNAQFEQYNVQFGKLISNSDDFKEKYKNVTDPLELQAFAAQEANDKMAMLAEFGAKTPFELPQVVEASKVLQGFGLNSTQAAKDFGFSGDEILTIAGDVAAGTGTDFAEMALNIGKYSKGATGESIARFMELGILTRDELSKLGVEFSKSGELISPLPEATTAMLQVMKDKYGGMMDAQSKTFSGMMSNLQDWVSGTLRTIGQPIFELLRGKLEILVGWLASPEVANAVQGFAESIASGLGNVIAFVEGTLVPAFQSIKNAIDLVATGDFTGGIFGLSEDSLPITLLIAFSDALDGFATGSVNGFIAGLANAAYALEEWVPFFGPVGDVLVLIGGIVDGFVAKISAGFAEGGAGGAVTSFIGVLSSLNPTFGILVSAVETALPFIQNIFTSVFGIVADFIAEKGPEIATFVVDAFNTMRTIVAEVTTVINSVITTVFGAVATFIQENQESIRSVIDTVWATIKAIIEGSILFIQTFIVPALQMIAQFISDHGEEIKGYIQGTWDIIKGVIEVAAAIIQGVIAVFTAVVKGDWEGAWTAIKDMFSGIWEGIKTIVDGAVTVLKNVLSTTWDLIKTVAQAAWDWIKDDIILATVNTIKDEVLSIFDDAKKGLDLVWDAIKSAAETAWKLVYDNIIKPIQDGYDWIAGKVSEFLSMGGQLMQGLIDGIVASLSGVVDAVVGVLTDVVDGAKSFLGIQSPSKVFHEIGNFTMLGATEGIQAGAPALVQSAIDAAQSLTDGMRTTIETNRDSVASTFQGSLDTIRSTIESQTTGIVSAGQTMVDTLFEQIGNRSASGFSTMGDVFKRSMSGVGEGILTSTNSIMEQVQDVFNKRAGAIQASVQINSPEGALSAVEGAFNQQVFQISANYTNQDERTVRDDIRYLQALGASL